MFELGAKEWQLDFPTVYGSEQLDVWSLGKRNW
jgi:hypothetical protein